MAVLSYNEILPKIIIKYNNEPYEVVSSYVFRMQQRKPVNQTKLRHLVSGKVVEVSFHQNESVTEADIGKIRVGQPVQFTVDAYPDSTFPGRVAEIRKDPAVRNVSSFIGPDGINTTINSGRIQIDLVPLEERGISSAPPGTAP